MKKIFQIVSLLLFLHCFSQNTLLINGRTNINSFKCANTKMDLVSGAFTTTTKLPELSLQVNDFDCRNTMMTSDFRKILNATTFPQMQIKFISLKKASEKNYDAIVEVKIMNKKRFYNIGFFENNSTFSGNGTVRFSDFGINPPKKMAGTIVVKDHLDLVFILSKKAVSL